MTDTGDQSLLPPQGELAAWLARLTLGSAAFAATSRAAIFLLALQQRSRETFYADLCDALLPPELRVSRALDIGCAAGNLSFELAGRLGEQVIGIDSDPYLVAWARRASSGEPFEFPVRLDAAHFGVAVMEPLELQVPVQFVRNDLFRPPFAPGTFELVTLVNVLDSVAEPEGALGRAAELLRPGGWLMFASPDSWTTTITPPQRWLVRPNDWDRLFASAGLETIAQLDDLEWRLKDTPRLHHIYRVHGRLLRKLED
ncbi:MAG: methyltransferase domain-containing protein [bacterium]